MMSKFLHTYGNSLILAFLLCNNYGIGFQTNEVTFTRQKRIIGGQKAGSGNYPWAVSIQAKRNSFWTVLYKPIIRHYCGGALIRPNWIITAAHCLYYDTGNDEVIGFLNPKVWHVRMASESLSPSILERIMGLGNRFINALFGDVKPQSFYHVEKIFQHPLYHPGYLEYDIALFKLKETPILNRMDHLELIKLPDLNVSKHWPPINQFCTAVGWGCNVSNGPPTLKVQASRLPILSPDDCENMYSADINLTIEHEFCAGYYKSGVGICPGDSGGPLVCEGSDRELRLAGIVSATHRLHPADYPGLFTRVSYFVDWIEYVIKNNPSKRPNKPLSFLRINI